MINVIQKPIFRKAYKKLHSEEKRIVDEAIQAIIQNPTIGDLKKGDLSGLSVYKFKINKQEKLLAYFFNKQSILLVGFGTRENFYREIKKNQYA